MTVCIPASHPSLEGHFPGRPIVPGVVLLDEIFCELGLLPTALAPTALLSVRFMRPVRPGDVMTVSLDGNRFAGRVDGDIVIQGTLG